MDISNQYMDTKLNRLRHMISTQMSLPYDCFGIDQLFRIQPLTSHISEWIGNSTFCTSYCVKYSSTIGISYELKPYMPLCLVIRLIPPSLLLLHCIPSKAFARFSIPCHCQKYFVRSSKTSCAQCQRALLPTFLARIGARLIYYRLHTIQFVTIYST